MWKVCLCGSLTDPPDINMKIDTMDDDTPAAQCLMGRHFSKISIGDDSDGCGHRPVPFGDGPSGNASGCTLSGEGDFGGYGRPRDVDAAELGHDKARTGHHSSVYTAPLCRTADKNKLTCLGERQPPRTDCQGASWYVRRYIDHLTIDSEHRPPNQQVTEPGTDQPTPLFAGNAIAALLTEKQAPVTTSTSLLQDASAKRLRQLTGQPNLSKTQGDDPSTNETSSYCDSTSWSQLDNSLVMSDQTEHSIPSMLPLSPILFPPLSPVTKFKRRPGAKTEVRLSLPIIPEVDDSASVVRGSDGSRPAVYSQPRKALLHLLPKSPIVLPPLTPSPKNVRRRPGAETEVRLSLPDTPEELEKIPTSPSAAWSENAEGDRDLPSSGKHSRLEERPVAESEHDAKRRDAAPAFKQKRVTWCKSLPRSSGYATCSYHPSDFATPVAGRSTSVEWGPKQSKRNKSRSHRLLARRNYKFYF